MAAVLRPGMTPDQHHQILVRNNSRTTTPVRRLLEVLVLRKRHRSVLIRYTTVVNECLGAARNMPIDDMSETTCNGRCRREKCSVVGSAPVAATSSTIVWSSDPVDDVIT